MLIKICGITNLGDAKRSIGYGANALGYNFYPDSPRYIDPVSAQRMIEQLPADILTVGIFVGWPQETATSIQVLQVHGLTDKAEERG